MTDTEHSTTSSSNEEEHFSLSARLDVGIVVLHIISHCCQSGSSLR